MKQLKTQLQKKLPGLKLAEPMSRHTTFKIGGPAEFFYIANTTQDLVKAVLVARELKLPFLLIGQGSNILVADRGIKGLVIKNQTSTIKILENEQVELDSGVFLPQAIFFLLKKGLIGLENFVGIPASVGGATYMNIHGNNKFWSDYLVSAKILASDGKISQVSKKYFDFKYDYSKLHQSKEIVLSVVLQLKQADAKKAMLAAKSFQAKKAHYPQASAGCIFQNLTAKEQQRLNLPTPSVGYLMDKVLNLKGKTVGQAAIAVKHAAFIENLGQAKASAVLQLIKLMKTKAKKELGVDLKLEIVMLGFNQKELEQL
jgi:UDP-N-acetylmuramate dehydrogenase